MTMIVKPKHNKGPSFDLATFEIIEPEELDLRGPIYAKAEDGVFVECEAVSPPSSEGKRVVLWVPAHDVDAIMLRLRENAIERRR